jgi:hypothetical protein
MSPPTAGTRIDVPFRDSPGDPTVCSSEVADLFNDFRRGLSRPFSHRSLNQFTWCTIRWA